jgi:hypothetical protein
MCIRTTFIVCISRGEITAAASRVKRPDFRHRIAQPSGATGKSMARYFTSFVLLAMLLASTVTHAQQGNMPVPVQKLPPYPPTVCVAPNWTTLSCDSRAPTYGPQNEPSGWQCDNVSVTEIVDSTVPSMEFLITGIERRDNRFKLEGFDRLYLDGKLCTRFKPQEIRFEIPVLLGAREMLEARWNGRTLREQTRASTHNNRAL